MLVQCLPNCSTSTYLPKVRDGMWEWTLGGNVRWHSRVMLNLKGQKETKGHGSAPSAPSDPRFCLSLWQQAIHVISAQEGLIDDPLLLQQNSGNSTPPPPRATSIHSSHGDGKTGIPEPKMHCCGINGLCHFGNQREGEVCQWESSGWRWQRKSKVHC